MTCAHCGSDNPAGKKFCGDCGAALENQCPQCGAANPANKKFCGDCGAPTTTSDTLSTQRPPTAAPLTTHTAAAHSPRSPRSYTPKHLTEKILNSRAALEGERKQVTVL